MEFSDSEGALKTSSAASLNTFRQRCNLSYSSLLLVSFTSSYSYTTSLLINFLIASLVDLNLARRSSKVSFADSFGF